MPRCCLDRLTRAVRNLATPPGLCTLAPTTKHFFPYISLDSAASCFPRLSAFPHANPLSDTSTTFPHRTTTLPIAKMAKGLRSSVKKSNRSKLRRKVFAPVEDARLERLHAKLLEAVHQPKASDVAKENDMDVEESTDGTKQHPAQQPASSNNPTTASKEKDMSEGSLISSAAIPQSLLVRSDEEETDSATWTSDDEADGEFLYLGLGLSSDIVGFTADGQLQLQFDY